MLVLSRRRNESIQIGDDVRISVLEVKGNRVSLGIEAPRDVTIHRDEVKQRIEAEMDHEYGLADLVGAG